MCHRCLSYSLDESEPKERLKWDYTHLIISFGVERNRNPSLYFPRGITHHTLKTQKYYIAHPGQTEIAEKDILRLAKLLECVGSAAPFSGGPLKRNTMILQ